MVCSLLVGRKSPLIRVGVGFLCLLWEGVSRCGYGCVHIELWCMLWLVDTCWGSRAVGWGGVGMEMGGIGADGWWPVVRCSGKEVGKSAVVGRGFNFICVLGSFMVMSERGFWSCAGGVRLGVEPVTLGWVMVVAVFGRVAGAWEGVCGEQWGWVVVGVLGVFSILQQERAFTMAFDRVFCQRSVDIKGTQDNRRRDAWNSGNKDGSRTIQKEDSKALVTIDGKCKESYANLKKLYDAQREQLSDASIEIKAYSQEAQKEKEDLKAKVEKWHNSSKNLSKLLNTQMSANDKFGLGSGLMPIIEEYESDSEDECVSIPTKQQETPSFANKQVKTPRETVKNQYTHSQKPKVDKTELGYGFTVNAVSTVVGKRETAVKPSAGCNWRPQRYHGGSKYNDGSSLRNFYTLKDPLDFNGGPGAFGGSKGYHWRIGLFNCKGYNDDLTYGHRRFSWTFFLRTKDETSAILKDFIRQIENQLNQKVKTIRCDNGTEFKNRDVIEFCGLKGIKREYSNARTPQQNGVAERKNRTLIEAARTMLADSFLPNTFWAEAVSTACYVLNRVLVTKPHNKTPYELLTGKTPIISYIRPFGCHVTILNTIDHLGKFAGKSDEGFLVGYSLQSKAFRVYNLVTKRVEENLHINFLENKPNVAGKGPNWLFDLDYLTDSMNYHYVSSENQANLHAGQQESNQNTGTKDKIDAGDSEKEDESAQDCFELPIWHSYSSTNTSASKSDNKRGGPREEEQVFLDDLARLQMQEKEANEEAEALRKNLEQETENLVTQAGAAKTSSTNIFSTVSTTAKASGTNLVNTSGTNLVSTASPNKGLSLSDTTNSQEDDFEIPPLEGIHEDTTDGIFTHSSYDDEGAEADFTNLETVVNVSPIPTSRINPSHPSALILGDPTSTVQTRSKVNKSSEAHAFVSYVQKQRRNNHKDFHHCLFACFLSQHEPKKISEALEDESWVDAMQEELLQFEIQKVLDLVVCLYGEKAIGTSGCLYQNKKGMKERWLSGTKPRLVALGTMLLRGSE
ncbi:ribonuclease H-like domain-containing protein [Tanacetum coccineum]|uniref:Ribonuclease H-like domain-containing protein n=1 Tax=Tanacetum coccineum TaxID=301880 RepID=A0ABQ5E8Q7_9ASTR